MDRRHGRRRRGDSDDVGSRIGGQKRVDASTRPAQLTGCAVNRGLGLMKHILDRPTRLCQGLVGRGCSGCLVFGDSGATNFGAATAVCFVMHALMGLHHTF